MPAYQNSEADVLFPANDFFETLKVQLLSGEMLQQEHGVVEHFLKVNGAELMRLLLQSYLNRLADNEPQHEKLVVGTDDVERTCKRRGCTRQLMTEFGQVEVRRTGYFAPCVSSLFPLDAQLNLSLDKFSHGLRLVAAEAAATTSFGEVVCEIDRHTAGHVAKRQAEELAQKVSQDFHAFYAQRRHEQMAANDLLVLTTDGKGIVVRQEDLREGTRRAAERECHKKQTRLSPGEKKNRKRMAQVASVYSVGPHRRTAEDILSVTDERPPVHSPVPYNKRVWASVEGSSGEVIDELFDEACRRDPLNKQQWVVLVDGHLDQLKLVTSSAAARERQPAVIMDFVHVMEYLWKAAHALFGQDSDESEEWVRIMAMKLLQSQTTDVSTLVRMKGLIRGLDDKRMEAVDKCANYLRNHEAYLDYQTALAQGWPIATGVIEGACRHLVKDRMDITGARWSLKGAESVLKLRSLRSSGDLAEYLKYHCRRERERNYKELVMAA